MYKNFVNSEIHYHINWLAGFLNHQQYHLAWSVLGVEKWSGFGSLQVIRFGWVVVLSDLPFTCISHRLIPLRRRAERKRNRPAHMFWKKVLIGDSWRKGHDFFFDDKTTYHPLNVPTPRNKALLISHWYSIPYINKTLIKPWFHEG